jgi:hypothetical protein
MFTLSTDILIQLAIEEYDRIISLSTNRGKAKEDAGVALSVTSSTNNHGNNGGRGGKPNKQKDLRPRGVCWNCGGKGHVKSKCPSPDMSGGDCAGKGKDNKKDTNLSGSANAAIAEENGAWSVHQGCDVFDDDDADSEFGSVNSWDYVHSNSSISSFEDEDDYALMPDLQSVSDSNESDDNGDDEGSDWLSKIDEFDVSEAHENSIVSEITFEFSLEARANGDVDGFVGVSDIPLNGEGEMTAAVLTDDALLAGPRVELYDSGSMEHLSPYHDQFTSYQDIPAKSFTAANKQNFDAIGSGNIVIEVPDSVIASRLTLTEVLYSPEIGYTLISVGHLDEAGLTATFGQGKCEIRAADGEHIGTVPKSSKGLYRVVHESVDPTLDGDCKGTPNPFPFFSTTPSLSIHSGALPEF